MVDSEKEGTCCNAMGKRKDRKQAQHGRWGLEGK